MFDAKSYLEDRGIDYKSEGKNISPGWIGIPCPFCDDSSYHLGIKDTGFNCWRCGEKGYIGKLIQKLDACNFQEADDIIEKFDIAGQKDLKKDIRRRLGENILPTECTKDFPEIHKDYLTSRNFPLTIIEKYDLYACFNLGIYKFRLIIPVIEDRYIVNFTARDVSGQLRTKYFHCPNEKAIIPMKECLYNIDSVRDTVIIVEGVTDVWRIGDGAVAVMGIEFSDEQVQLLVKRGVKKAYVMFDSEPLAIKRATKLSNLLSIFMKSEVIELSDGDPGDLSDEQVSDLRKELSI